MLDIVFQVLGSILEAAGEAAGETASEAASSGATESIHFGSTVEFPDGTQVEDPYTDAQGQVYKTRSDYLSGNDPHILE